MLIGEHIYKNYGSIPVLKGVNISIQKGELVSIVGPSGSGKSTLLHILGTLENADTGKAIINGIETKNLSRNKVAAFRNKHIGFVFQFHHLLPEFSALENICIPGWISGRGNNEVKAEAKKLLQILGLSHRVHHKPNQLSGGEQQRVAVARALINKPDIVLADEPTGNLDSIHAKELHQIFLELKLNLNQTFLVVTHNEELAQLSDRILRMQDGVIVN